MKHFHQQRSRKARRRENCVGAWCRHSLSIWIPTAFGRSPKIEIFCLWGRCPTGRRIRGRHIIDFFEGSLTLGPKRSSVRMLRFALGTKHTFFGVTVAANEMARIGKDRRAMCPPSTLHIHPCQRGRTV